MKTKSLLSKVLAAALAVVMLVGLVPNVALAASDEANVEGLELSKTAELAEDGTYTIRLEAYATGELQITEESVPLDIVLVLDQSGSMGYSFTYDEASVTYEQFDGSYYDAYTSEVYHLCGDGTYKLLNVTREWKTLPAGYKYTFSCSDGDPNCPFGSHGNQCFLAGFTQHPSSDRNWGHLVLKKVTGSTETTRIEALKLTLNKFVQVVRDDANQNNVNHKIAIVGFGSQSGNGDNTEILTVSGSNTNVDNGKAIGVAYNSLKDAQYSSALVDRNASIVDQAIGALAASGATRTDLGMEMAMKILAKETDSSRKKVVIMFTDGVPTSSNTFNTTVASDAIEYAYSMKQDNTDIYTVGIFDDADASTLISNITGNTETDNANRFMHAVSTNYPNATTWGSYGNPGSTIGYYMSADSSSQLDKVFDNIAQSVTGSTKVTLDGEACLKDVISDEFRLPDDFSAEQNISVQISDWDGSKFGTPHSLSQGSGITASVDPEKKTISVTGFSYKDNYCITGQSGGQKLVITITGIEATDSAVIGEDVSTNAPTSGIYENGAAVAPIVQFSQPKVKLYQKSFVLDYAKKASLNCSDLFANVIGLDDASDKVLNDASAWFSDGVFDGEYGELTNNGGALTYTPKTTMWDSYDSVYAFGKDSTNAYAWAKLSVIPANNVYYEDTFVTDSDSENGTVGIVFSEGWTKVVAGSNGEDVNGSVQGWVKDLADDTGDSDGTVTMTSSKLATATFTFTGTGFDVYSRTNLKSGKVYAKISWKDAEGGKHNQGLVVDTESASGEYYSIPTLFYSGEYNTYTVKLTVQNDAEDGASYSYCIDGIRIYNPLNPETMDETVADAYGEELNATFESVRDMLLDAGSLNSVVDNPETVNGYVFIDKADGTVGGTTNVIVTYKDYGPKNEVYLAPGNAIAFYVGTEVKKLHVGLKAPEGGAATAKVSGGGFADGLTVGHTTDLYYEVSPDAKGFVVIQNASQNNALLSVTKVKFFAGDGVAETTADELIAAVDRFDAMAVLPYTSKLTPGITDSDIVIENPGPANGNPAIENSAIELLRKLFSDFRGWFHS